MIKALFCTLLLLASFSGATNGAKIKVKVFIAAMFEIGENQGDKAGEFQHWYLTYFKDVTPIMVKGAKSPVYCNQEGVCGAVLGMGKVASSVSMQAILLNDKFHMQDSYFV